MAGKKLIGIVGYRGMVGSALIERMKKHDDFAKLNEAGFAFFFFSSNEELIGTDFNVPVNEESLLTIIQDSSDVSKLAECDFIVTCQGADWSNEMHSKLILAGWEGLFIDASSAFRTRDDALIVLDPINRNMIDSCLKNGVRIFCGGNCTTSLMMLAIQGLLKEDLVESIFASTYQAVSGAGAKAMQELVAQNEFLCRKGIVNIKKPQVLAADLFTGINQREFPKKVFGKTLAYSILPWIDGGLDDGRTKEEWKGEFETNKILGFGGQIRIPVDSMCVRVPVLRCHSQSLFIKLKENCDLKHLVNLLAYGNEWVHFVQNDKKSTLEFLNPEHVAEKDKIMVGRIHKGSDPKTLKLFTVGDQLIWGAAEPIRRMLLIACGRL